MTNYANIRYQPAAASTTTVADMAALIALTGMSNGDQALVLSSNNLFMYSGTGWYKIATIQNDSPTAITGVNGTYELATDGTPTVITAVSTDPEGFPLTWSYSTSGLGSIATVSQADNVFTITPSTDDANGGTFSLTINATDGVNGAVSTNTSIELEFVITNSKYTTLLATAVDTSSNSNITDSSTNNHTITVLGDANAGTFSPYRHGGYSTYFDGTGDNYTVPSGLHLGTGDFTFEFWIWPDEDWTNTAGKVFMNTETSGSGNTWTFNVSNYGGYNGLTFGYGVYASYTVGKYVDNYWVPQGEWTHLVAQRRNGTIEIYVNGVSQTLSTYNENGTFSDSVNLTSNLTTRTLFNGVKAYVSDLRLVTGSYVYDGDFTPSTENITAVTNTTLLTNQNQFPYLVDNSPNAYTITTNDNTSIKPFSRYDNFEYSASDNGGSIYFDGTDDGLIVPAAGWDRDADYTVECWAYAIGSLTIALSRNRKAADGAVFSIGGSYTVFLGIGRDDVNSWDLTYTGSVDLRYQWHHLALTHDASEKRYKIYIDGVNIFNGTSAYHPGSLNSVFNIGCSDTMNSGTTSYSQGWIADHKITDSIVYTSNFTPPAAPLSTISGTTLHLKGTDASIIDKSQSSNLKLVGNTTGSTTQVKFADTKSMYFDGSGDYIITPQQELGTEDFTIEGWHYLLTRANNRNGIFGNYSSYSAGSLGMFAGHSSATTTSYQVAYNGDTFPANVIQGGTIAYNQWVHFAVVRNSGTMNLYINGTSVDSISATASLNGVGSNLIVGAPGDNLADGMHGYLEDFRITKGLARYTANFTPPTEPLKG